MNAVPPTAAGSKAPRLVLPGGAGYLGRRVAAHFAAQGWHVTILSRGAALNLGDGIAFQRWDGETLGPWAEAIDGAAAVINLAGRTVNCRYHERNRREIYDSRLRSTAVLGQAISQAAAPPAVWLNSASATIYRHAEDRPMDERTGELGTGFSVDVCRQWEATLDAADTPNTRKVALRSAMVFGTGADGVFGAFYNIVKLGLGGTLGPGTQYVSWIHEADFCAALEWLIARSQLAGAVNLASPHPLPNREFMRTLRQVADQPIGLPATRWMLEIGAFALRTETELLLKSRRVIPTRLLEDGFTFRYPVLEPAVREILSRWK